MKKLKELLDYIQPTKYIVSSDQYSNEYSIPVLTAGDTFLLGFTNDNDGIYPASKNNPIILFDDFTTAIKWVDFPFKVKSSACKILVPINGANLKYCYYAMRALNFDHTMHKRYWISEYSEQSINDYGQKNQLIVNELDTINSLIDLKKKRLADFDEIIKSRFIEIFGDVLENDKGFDTCKFGDYVIQMNIGPFGSDLKNDCFVQKEKGYCMVYEQKHAIDKYMTVEARYVSKEKYEKLKRFDIGPGDIIVSCRGTIGECFMLPNDAPHGIIHPSLMMLKPKDEVNHKFLVFLLEHILAEQSEQGSGVKMAIKATDLAKIQTIKPPRNVQDVFIAFVNRIDKSKFVVQQQINDLQELLNKKMDEYFDGGIS